MKKAIIFIIIISSLLVRSNFCYSYAFDNNVKRISELYDLENAISNISRKFGISEEEAFGVYIIADMELFAKICNEEFKDKNKIINVKNKLFKSRKCRDAYNFIMFNADFNLPDRNKYCYYGRKAYSNLLK